MADGADMKLMPMAKSPGFFERLKMLDYQNCENWLAYLQSLFGRYGDVIRLSFLGHHLFAIRNPADFDKIFKQALFEKKGDFHRYHHLLMGDGLVTSSGNERWKQTRRVLQPHYTNKRLKGYVTQMVASSEKMFEGWDKHVEAGEHFDAHHFVRDLTLDINLKCLLVNDFDPYVEAFHKIMDDIMDPPSFFDLAMPKWIPTLEYFKYKKIVDFLDKVIYEVVEKRGGKASDNGDYLDSLLDLHIEDPELMPLKSVRDEVVTLLIAGHETTSSALAWAMHLLTEHPDKAAKLGEEADRVLGGRAPTLEDLDKLVYAGHVANEAMRMYPPIMIFIPRTATEDTELSGTRVPKGSQIFMFPYCAHRHPDVWKNPDTFDPDRYEDADSAKVIRLSLMPFASGRRKCAGALFATYEMKIMLAMMAQRYHTKSSGKVKVEPTMVNGALAPKNGIWLEATHRKES